jgi:hypothetical protein
MRLTGCALAAASTLISLAGLAGVDAPVASAATTYAVTRTTDARTGAVVVVRWSPCTTNRAGTVTTHTITYRVNTGGSAARVALVQTALADVTSASGLRFRYLGTTTYVPHYAVLHYASGDRYMFNASQQRAATGAELVIGWVAASRSNLFSGTEAGVGTKSWGGSSASQTRITEGAALLKLGVRLLNGFSAGSSTGSLLLHEIGHAVGLEHVSERTQIMYPALGTWTPAAYGTGDRAGLRIVGRPAGCFRTSTVGPTDPVAIARAAGVPVTA